MNTVQKALTGALFAAAFGLTSPVWAVDCSTVDTVGEFDSVGSCTDDDKIYTFIDSDLSPTIGLTFVSGSDVHALFVGGATPIFGVAGGGILHFNYSIEVDLDLSPTATITSVDLDTTVGNLAAGGTTSAVKEVFDIDGNMLGTLTSNNGNPAPTLGVNETYLLIEETFSKTSTAILFSSQNTFHQETSVVPEPGTLALLGIGLLGLAGVARRKS